MEKPEYAVTQSCFNANLIVVHNIKENMIRILFYFINDCTLLD